MQEIEIAREAAKRISRADRRAKAPLSTIEPVRVLLVGCGPHAARTHVPWLRKDRSVQLTAVVELETCESKATEVVRQFDNDIDVVLVRPWSSEAMPTEVRAKLDLVVAAHRFDAIIIATEPLSHLSYLVWAIGTGAHVFVDKPIVVLPNASNSPDIARRLEVELVKLVALADRRPNQLVAVGTQRRYHPAFIHAKRLLVEAAARFGTALTAMESSHADGQFRHPHELESMTYHGFRDGCGKLSHSGYHEVALQADFAEATAAAAGTYFDGLTSYAVATRPAGFLRQIPRQTYETMYGSRAWSDACPDGHDVLAERMRGFGEIDVFATNAFTRGGDNVLLSHIGLMHTSVSQRSALESNVDLYKGNGRVKHEAHNLELGPFMDVKIESYQSKSDHEQNDEQEFRAGGNNHIEVSVYRNAGFWGPNYPRSETFSAADMASEAGMPATQMFTGFAKERMLDDFFDCVTGRQSIVDHKSRIGSHLLGGSMLSAIFESVATQAVAERSLYSDAHSWGDAA